MGRFVIVGAGIGGLVTALMLGRAGHEVVVCERDASPVPADAEEMWSSWPRPGTPQARLGHTFLAGFRRMLEARLPDVIDDVLSVGGSALGSGVGHAWGRAPRGGCGAGDDHGSPSGDGGCVTAPGRGRGNGGDPSR